MTIWLLLAAHAIGIFLIVGAGERLGRGAFAIAAIAPAATAIWAATTLDGSSATASVSWVEGLDLEFRFAMGGIAAVMTLLVAGIGALVFVYAAGYFRSGTPGLGRFAATLASFGTAMTGLVLADSIWTLFVFWELTSVTSFLLVGHKNVDAAVRAAARRALVITVAGGLALLGGLVVIADQAGTARLSEMGPIDGTAATVAATAVLVAAATKSAQVPFHVWLPGAMAAPTPVSAYLHSATMVKAGVLVIALLAPTLAEVGVWKPLGLTFGIATMAWGAITALRHVDAKLILAWGTVSQLGLLVTLLATGTGKAVFAAISILVAHALFKAALFMVVGEIDVRTGTRDIRELNGLAQTMPVTFAVACLGAASMVGAPPLLGFMAKEAAIEAVLGLSGAEALVVGAAIIGGSVLTMAYTVRFLIGVFGGDGEPTDVRPTSLWLSGPSALLAAAGVAGFIAAGSVSAWVRAAAVEVHPDAEVYSLIRWPGFKTAFVISLAIIAVGAVAGWLAAQRDAEAPEPRGAAMVDASVDGVLAGAGRITAVVQHGSLPVYLVTMSGVAALAAVPFVTEIDLDALRWADNATQAVLAVVVVAAAAAAGAVGSRIGAALGLGAVGFAVAGLFAVQGAPDLVLTQLLVETVIVVGFVVGLGHLARRFPPPSSIWRATRLVVSGLVGLAVAVALAASASAPVGDPPIEALLAESADEGGGNNVVNVILTDMRALDTLGEILVLAVVAVGILALSRVGRSESGDLVDAGPDSDLVDVRLDESRPKELVP